MHVLESLEVQKELGVTFDTNTIYWCFQRHFISRGRTSCPLASAEAGAEPLAPSAPDLRCEDTVWSIRNEGGTTNNKLYTTFCDL